MNMKREKEGKLKMPRSIIRNWRTKRRCRILMILQGSNITKIWRLEKEPNSEPEDNNKAIT